MKREIGDYIQDIIDSYFGLRLERVWETVQEEIPPLKPLFERVENDLEK